VPSDNQKFELMLMRRATVYSRRTDRRTDKHLDDG